MRQAVLAKQEERFPSVAREMGQWVEQVLGPGFSQFRPGKEWAPAVNLYEDETRYYMIVDLAGVKAKQIDLRVEDGVIILAGERPSPGVPESKGLKRLHLMEIEHGPFCRKIELPGDAALENVEAIEAWYRSGYLCVEIPKK